MFFAQLRELMKTDNLNFTLSEDKTTTVKDIVNDLEKDHEGLADYLKQGHQLLNAVNQKTVDVDHVLKSGDELALFPPVTGG